MSTPLRGLHIGLLTSSASRLGGGVFEAVANQAEMIRSLGGRVTVFALRDARSDADRPRFDGSALVHCEVLGPAQIGFAPELIERMVLADLDCLHLHGIWMYPSRAATMWSRQTGKQYIISTHGMLDPTTLARNSWKKHLATLFYERANWTAAARFHALTGNEASNIARQHPAAEIVTIANAGPPARAPTAPPRDPTVVYVGRIHEVKNLVNLVEGWSSAKLPAEAKLIIAGWGAEQDVESLTRKIAAAGPSIQFIGPIFGEDKRALIASARFMILPSHSEAMPMTILEGWAECTPSIMTQACNLPEGFAAGAALECGPDPDSIAAALERGLALASPQWRAMSAAAHGLAAGPFSAENIGSQWAAEYLRLA